MKKIHGDSQAAERKGIKVSPEVHKQIDIESSTTGIPIYSLVESAWALYLLEKQSGKARSAKGSPSHPSETDSTDGGLVKTKQPDRIRHSEYSGWLSLLEAILDSKNPVAIEAITRNLRAFGVLIELDIEGRVADYKVPTPVVLAPDLTRAAERLKRASAADRSRNAANIKRIG